MDKSNPLAVSYRNVGEASSEHCDPGSATKDSGSSSWFLSYPELQFYAPNSCQVEIPVLQQACSNGTQVNISDNQMKSTTYTPLMTAVGAASAIPVTLLVLIWILLQRRRCKSRENPIYSNMPPPRSAIKQPSPHPGIQMDNQKIPSPLKHTRTPPTAHYSEHLRTPTPARANDRQLFRTPNPPRVHEGKHLTIPTPATAHDNKFSPKP
eukprot:XP_014072381.1 PREDICTED: transmembrane and immunoglobulin domain-containing protein 2 isoform X4 [Salmo salar]